MGRRGSDSGYHFVQDYRKCKRYFYNKYVNRLVPLEKSPALLFGGCMHLAMETWYGMLGKGRPVHDRVRGALETFENEINKVRDQYVTEDMFLRDVQRGQDILRQYGLQYANENWLVLGIEEDLEITLSSGDVFTGRLDLAVKSGVGLNYIIDHKFTGWSMSNVIKTMQNSDQATSYKMMWEQKYPDKPINAVIFNICRAYKGDVKFHQLPIAKMPQDVEEFKVGIQDDLSDIATRIADPDRPWPKNTDRCFDYNRPCEYLPLCQGVNFDGLIGVNYKILEPDELVST